MIVGQDRAVEQFASNWATRKLHHAWLLAGPKGVGKATFALAAAKRVLGLRYTSSGVPACSIFSPGTARARVASWTTRASFTQTATHSASSRSPATWRER